VKCISIWPIVGMSEVVFALYLILAVQYVLGIPCGFVITGKCGTATEKRYKCWKTSVASIPAKTEL